MRGTDPTKSKWVCLKSSTSVGAVALWFAIYFYSNSIN
jgi:hypothetical protein